MIITSLLVAAGVYALGVGRAWRGRGVGQAIAPWQAASFAVGWLTLVVAMLSPLDEWSETSFTAHMVQHELLMVVAAPLLAFGGPLSALTFAIASGPRRAVVRPFVRSLGVLPAALTCALHAIALWIWHLPALYDAALANEAVHALQHLSFLGTAVLFWWVVAHGHNGRLGYGVAVLYVFATSMQSGLLGALITLSRRIWYAPYASQSAWGLSPIEDQQVAGLIMWIPATIVFSAAGIIFLLAWLRESTRRVDRFGPTHPVSSLD